VSQAKAQADQLLAETKTDAERRRAAAQREVDELTRQKDSIATHLAQVRQLLGGQLPMDAAMQAPAPKPAIAADPVPSAPPPPHNGAAVPPAPTMAQPAQPGPAVTQVSSAPTQVHQRPTNGGSLAPSPAAAQASAKQRANGKDDDDDWWTE